MINIVIQTRRREAKEGFVADVALSWGTECHMFTTAGDREDIAAGKALTEVRKRINLIQNNEPGEKSGGKIDRLPDDR